MYCLPTGSREQQFRNTKEDVGLGWRNGTQSECAKEKFVTSQRQVWIKRVSTSSRARLFRNFRVTLQLDYGIATEHSLTVVSAN
jgi:hypothetical protein